MAKNILGIIPARGGSKGIPGKNIKPLAGKPLLQYTIEAAQNSSKITRLILSSDDPEIIAISEKHGLEAPFLRPSYLAEDNSSSLDVIQHALQFFKDKGEDFDAICLLQPTTPFRRNNLIDDAIGRFLEQEFDSLISVRQVPEEYNPHWVFEEKNGSLKIATGEKKIISRRQELPKAWHRDGAIYLTKSEVIMNENSLFGSKIGFIDTSEDPYVNIDTPDDWQKAEKMIRNLK